MDWENYRLMWERIELTKMNTKIIDFPPDENNVAALLKDHGLNFHLERGGFGQDKIHNPDKYKYFDSEEEKMLVFVMGLLHHSWDRDKELWLKSK